MTIRAMAVYGSQGRQHGPQQLQVGVDRDDVNDAENPQAGENMRRATAAHNQDELIDEQRHGEAISTTAVTVSARITGRRICGMYLPGKPRLLSFINPV